MLIFDAHLDLAMNAMEWNRDLRRPISEIRERDRHYCDKVDRGNGVVCFPEMRRGQVGLCVSTLIARYVKPENTRPGWHSPEQAWAQTQGQLAWYRTMEEQGEISPILNRSDLEKHFQIWNDTSAEHSRLPIGYLLSLEGADSIFELRLLERAYQAGLRALGPGHYGPGTYAHGTGSQGGLGPKGRELLREMEQLNIILDVTHLSDESFWEALDHYSGPVWASHSNARAIVPKERQFDDRQIKALIDRGAVIGGVLEASMLIPQWQSSKSKPAEIGLKLEQVIDHMDHICQLAGNANHIGIGSDLDGAFGKESSPADIETIADLQKLPDLLRARGYTLEQIKKITHGNFIAFLERAWSK